MKEFSEKLRKYRKIRGMSQRELADKLGFKPNTISNYESDISEPDIKTLLQIVNILDVSLGDLLGTGGGVSSDNEKITVAKPNSESKKEISENEILKLIEIIASQQASIEKMSEASLSHARSIEQLLKSKKSPDEVSKAG